MRYLPLTEATGATCWRVIGVPSVDALFRDVPQSARLTTAIDLPPHQGELEVERALSAMAAKNVAAGSVPFFSAPAPIAIMCRPASTT
jgi:glycine dehydrogenase subunit 1